MESLHPLVTITTDNNSSRKARSSTFFDEMPVTPTTSRDLASISVDSDTDNEKPSKISPTSRKRIEQKRPHASTQSTSQKAARMSERELRNKW